MHSCLYIFHPPSYQTRLFNLNLSPPLRTLLDIHEHLIRFFSSKSYRVSCIIYLTDTALSAPCISRGRKPGLKTSKQMRAWMNHLMGEMDDLHRKVRLRHDLKGVREEGGGKVAMMKRKEGSKKE